MGFAKELRQRRTVEAREVVVPEWGDESGAFKLYCKPITCADLQKLQIKHPNFLENTTIEAMVDLIIIKALDEDGKKIFAPLQDRKDLMEEETTVISEIANQMFADIESQEALAKN
jgi:hypothetical protein